MAAKLCSRSCRLSGSNIFQLRLISRALFTNLRLNHNSTTNNVANEDSPEKENAEKENDPEEMKDPQIKLLEEEKVKLNEKVEDLEDKYRRALAEAENVRLRMQKQINDTKLFGIQGFCKDLLEVADILGAATKSVPVTEINASNPHLNNLFEGLKMTEVQLNKVFTKNGLIQINPKENEKFDPFQHEALFQSPVPDKEPGTVALVTKIGYKLHSRTIRPALVGVVKAP